MPYFKIYAGSLNEAQYHTTEEFEDEDAAVWCAYNLAREDYDSYAGLHGIRDIKDILDEEGCSMDEAEAIYLEEMENTLDYYVVETDTLEDTDE